MGTDFSPEELLNCGKAKASFQNRPCIAGEDTGLTASWPLAKACRHGRSGKSRAGVFRAERSRQPSDVQPFSQRASLEPVMPKPRRPVPGERGRATGTLRRVVPSLIRNSDGRFDCLAGSICAYSLGRSRARSVVNGSFKLAIVDRTNVPYRDFGLAVVAAAVGMGTGSDSRVRLWIRDAHDPHDRAGALCGCNLAGRLGR